MKRNITLLILVCFFIFQGSTLLAQGLETFANYPETGNSYHDGTFIGLDGSTWSYFQCRGDSVITAPTPTLGKNRTPTSEVSSGQLANGIGTLSFDYEQVFSTNVSLDVMVNGVLVTTVTTTAEQGVVKNTGPISVNVPGTFTLKFIQNNTGAGQVSIDNITWTAFGGGTPDPEPSNYPTSFAATGAGVSIKATWTDATGTQLPSSYLVKISKTDNITAPVDGTYVSDDIDLSDGSGSKNVTQGTQAFTFSKGLDAATTYYLKIYPYTNAGSLVDYKTDGTAPSANARTQAILFEQDFEAGISPWTEFSVLGEQTWVLDSIHGVDNSMCLKMTGFVSSTSTIANEDWLISPSMNIPSGSSPKLEFYSAMNYGTGTTGIAAYISTDYNSGDPTASGTWTDISSQCAFSAGGWTWTSSGFIDISAYTGPNVHVAFKYTCEAANAPTWEFDNVTVTNNSGVGFSENMSRESACSIYPNPCTNGFKVQIPAGSTFKLSILSPDGSSLLVKEISQNNTFIPTNNLPSGIYMVSIENLGSRNREMHKLIIQ